MNNKTLLVVFAVGGLTAGVVASRYFLNHDSTTVAAPATTQSVPSPVQGENLIGKPRPNFALVDLQGKTHVVNEWNNNVIIVNFWATWCPPCVKEMPTLMKLRETYKAKGFEIIGVALDSKDAVSAFIDPLGIDYPILLAEQEGIGLSQEYGNQLGALPYSVVIDRQGVMRHTISGELTYEKGEALIKPLL
jgi:thiol-disulfide isomerase/thioredoxin